MAKRSKKKKGSIIKSLNKKRTQPEMRHRNELPFGLG